MFLCFTEIANFLMLTMGHWVCRWHIHSFLHASKKNICTWSVNISASNKWYSHVTWVKLSCWQAEGAWVGVFTNRRPLRQTLWACWKVYNQCSCISYLAQDYPFLYVRILFNLIFYTLQKSPPPLRDQKNVSSILNILAQTILTTIVQNKSDQFLQVCNWKHFQQ